ncbi:hypothetical protein PCANC_20668 [Puccinia coronata f. sp. avenae]|uniref:Uncharacterized protein n=1 Tax=Puccinia coronata f. sp. avenae TaxID=200324 RepID=A0A2N5UQ01_9BASI|nr:hypothetical protein PCANC_20668 [Puccinia coronata f. sp. avenae]
MNTQQTHLGIHIPITNPEAIICAAQAEQHRVEQIAAHRAAKLASQRATYTPLPRSPPETTILTPSPVTATADSETTVPNPSVLALVQLVLHAPPPSPTSTSLQAKNTPDKAMHSSSTDNPSKGPTTAGNNPPRSATAADSSNKTRKQPSNPTPLTSNAN